MNKLYRRTKEKRPGNQIWIDNRTQTEWNGKGQCLKKIDNECNSIKNRKEYNVIGSKQYK